MSVQFQNFEFSYLKDETRIFVPSQLGRKIGNDLKRQIEDAVVFDEFFFHLRSGGHVAALHAHRKHKYFARTDIRRFYPSIGRNRVKRVLDEIGVDRATHYAKWSCVKNMDEDQPTYILPYGFVQSPLLATLVLMQSGAGSVLRSIAKEIELSVYVDDISISCDDKIVLSENFAKLCKALEETSFHVNEQKTLSPRVEIDIFNCDLKQGVASVSEARISEFENQERSELSREAFFRYRERVEAGNS